ncbi:hypothetical protein [Niallia circulans]|uniref:hypothetical protein n=1 Tax=Niallia circulans TaxID=1397 RepID=UPI0026EFCD00|nr:hypothetical protein [Niallia circulans]
MRYKYGVLEGIVHKEYGTVYRFLDEKGKVTNFDFGMNLIDCLNILGKYRWELKLQNNRNDYILVKEI